MRIVIETAALQPASLIASLREIAQTLSAAWDVGTTLDLIARKTTQVMRVDSCSIYLLEPEGDTLWLRASTGLALQALGRTALRRGEGLTGWAAQHGAPVAVRDAQADPRFKFLPQTRESNLHSLLAVPLVNRGRVIGAMNVQTREAHDFTAEQVELAALISDLAAGAIDRALLYDHMNRQIGELTTLAKVSATVTSPLYLDEMLDLVVEMAAKVMGAPVCTLRLIDASGAQLVLRAVKSVGVAYNDRPPLRIGEGITGLAVRERRPVTVLDIRTDPRYPFPDLVRAEGLVSMLSVPLRVRERVIGALNCYTTQPHVFGDAEVALFSTLANQTALAIENAQLVTNAAIVREMHHRIKNNLQTVAMLLRMQASGGSGLTAQDVLQIGVNRILSIAAVHEVLSQEGFRLVNVKDVTERIAQTVAQNMLRPGLHVQISVEGEPVTLPSRAATSLALVINELLQNALEHAFVDRTAGRVLITLGQGRGELVVEVGDDGVGLPAGQPQSLGLEIVETLVRDDLHGRLAFNASAAGTHVIVRVPHQPNTEAE
ncbi:MAG: GAF domain-containing protein [Anaerolineales bacterium]|nr:GAF domain-containing protein [Anaerolineales bacterium]